MSTIDSGAIFNTSNTIDLYSDTANMYGCQPCPKCKGKFRYPATRDPNLTPEQDDRSLRIFCDDCGFVERGEHIERN